MISLVILALAALVVIVGVGFLFFGQKKTDDNDEGRGSYEYENHGFWSKSKKTIGIIFLGGGTIAFICLWIMFSIVITPAGSINVVKTFGKVDITRTPLTEGLSFIMPYQSVETMSIRQRHLDRNQSTKSSMDVISKDRTKLNTDVTFYWTLNPVAGAWIYQKFGKMYYNSLQVPSAAGSLRDVVGKVETWNTLVEKKLSIEIDATKAFKESVIAKLLNAGIPSDIANNAFTFPKIDIRRVTPPGKILVSIENKKAALEELDRQDTEIKIAKLKAQKGAQEGLRVRNMLLAIFNPVNKDGMLDANAKLPTNFDPKNIPGIINAIASKQNAQSVQTAVEKNDVNTILIPASTPISVPVK